MVPCDADYRYCCGDRRSCVSPAPLETGRTPYPADIFYFHSRLLERGCQYKDGGSITILPVMETKSGDITDYISTNIISITDGQIVLSREAFVKGEKPAINYGLSVSRLGGSVQDVDMKKLGASMRQILLSYLETRAVYELANEDEMSKELQEKLYKGRNILNALLQYKYSPLSKEQIIERFNGINVESKVEEKSNVTSVTGVDNNVVNEEPTFDSNSSSDIINDVDIPSDVEVLENNNG